MHKTEETAKESRLNVMYSHLRNRTLADKGIHLTALWSSVRIRLEGGAGILPAPR